MVHLAEILISTENVKPEEAEKRANDAEAELKGGAKFSEVVKKYSDDPSADQGGDISLHEDRHPSPGDCRSRRASSTPMNIPSRFNVKSGYLILQALGTFQPRHPPV